MNGSQITKEKGWTECILDNNCGFEKLHAATEALQTHLGFRLVDKIDDFDTVYIDFEKQGIRLTLHYNIYLGLSLHPTFLKEAAPEENLAVLQNGERLFDLLKEDG